MSTMVQYSYKQKLRVIGDLLCHKHSMTQIAQDYDIELSLVRNWYNDVFKGDLSVLNRAGEALIKDENLIISDFNQAASLIGTRQKIAIGLSDYDICPEYADLFRQNSIDAMTNGEPLPFVVPSYHKYFEWLEYKGMVYPIQDDNGESRATLILANMNKLLFELKFTDVVKAVWNGYANIIANKESYTALIQNNGSEIQKVVFSRREVECLIYLLCGLPLKTISEHMKIALKTIEKMITLMNKKVGVCSKVQLVKTLESNGFFEDI